MRLSRVSTPGQGFKQNLAYSHSQWAKELPELPEFLWQGHPYFGSSI